MACFYEAGGNPINSYRYGHNADNRRRSCLEGTAEADKCDFLRQGGKKADCPMYAGELTERIKIIKEAGGRT